MRRETREQELTAHVVTRGAALRRTAYLVVRDWQIAEDVVQAAFAKLYVAWPRVREEGVDAYTRRIVVNEAISVLRRRRPETLTDVVPDRPSPDQEGVLDLGAALAVLPTQQRAVVALRFVEDQSVAETARILGIAEGTVKSQTSRATETLRKHLTHATSTEEIR